MSKSTKESPQYKLIDQDDEAQKKDRPVSNIQSFKLDITSTYELRIGTKYISMSDVYDILVARGISETCPKVFKLPDTFVNVDWNPYCYVNGNKPLYFMWDDVKCSIVSNSVLHLYFRIHTLDVAIAKSILMSFTKECLAKWKEPISSPKTLTIYNSDIEFGRASWSKSSSRKHRSIDTIYINNDVKSMLIQELEMFMTRSTMNMYDRYGVTWKRVHLFQGPPGTGKTSTIIALASHFNKDVAKVTLTPSVSSIQLEQMFHTVPPNSYLVLEDVDALFQDRNARQGVDFSTMLNCMDGISTPRGLVVFMTTNYPKKLDSAFIRPGRVDKVVKFESPNGDILLDALKSLAPDFEKDHIEFIEKYSHEMSIAGLQQHVFQTIMQSKSSILYEPESKDISNNNDEGDANNTNTKSA